MFIVRLKLVLDCFRALDYGHKESSPPSYGRLTECDVWADTRIPNSRFGEDKKKKENGGFVSMKLTLVLSFNCNKLRLCFLLRTLNDKHIAFIISHTVTE